MTSLRATPGRLVALVIGLPLMLAGVSWGAFGFVGLLARTSEHHHASYAWSGGPISLALDSGDVQIRTSDTRAVEVDYTEHYELKRPAVHGTASSAGVALTGRCPTGIFAQNCSINYVISVPRQAALALRVGDGAISLTGVTATVTAHTGDGAVNGTGLRSKDLQASVGDGGVRLQWAAAPQHVQASVGDGSVNVTVPTGSGPYAIRQSGSGSSDIQVATSPSAPASMILHAGDGSVRVRYGS
jgi:Putative adhesin